MKNKLVDDYISKSEDFAKPILRHLRQLIHKASPGVEEKIKWGFPHFDYNDSMMCSMAAFKHHGAFSFWKAAIMSDPHKLFDKPDNNSMGHLGRLKSLKDLPSDKILIEYIKEAIALNKAGAKLPARFKTLAKKNLEVPDYFLFALKKNKKALATFDNFSPSCKREYVDWITDAKTKETRNKRLKDAVEWMSEGKIRNWKYLKK
ncbi:MAG TPA: YdeI/OmpD-associated family protein [Nitrosopumilaceae archaeon]|nr:YdeI/OmpD-associated family protein [Nitrosopumilaceae archaeon]